MHTPKFRAWDKREGLEKMYFLTGFVQYGEGWTGGNPKHKFYEIHYGNGGFNKVSANEIELMMSTGGQASNGIEIYEGDIIEAVYQASKFLNIVEEYTRHERTLVTWNPKSCGFDLPIPGEFESLATWKLNEMSTGKKWKVIGNRIQNPELLIPFEARKSNNIYLDANNLNPDK